MKIAIVTNMNGRGLEHDANVVRILVERAGHSIKILQFNRPEHGRYDLTIFLEVAPRWAEGLARTNWWIPNPEWASQELPFLFFDCVLCKTHDAARLLRAHTPRLEFVGFSARDRKMTDVKRERRFFHAPGKSIIKGTKAIMDAWSVYEIPYTLTVVGDVGKHFRHSPNVRRLGWLSDEDLLREQNSAAFHLAPSAYEGFGHSIHESLSCGAIVARTDAPPMNEVPGIPIAAQSSKRMRLAMLWDVSPESVRDAVERCAKMDDLSVRRSMDISRSYYEHGRKEFERRFTALLGKV